MCDRPAGGRPGRDRLRRDGARFGLTAEGTVFGLVLILRERSRVGAGPVVYELLKRAKRMRKRAAAGVKQSDRQGKQRILSSRSQASQFCSAAPSSVPVPVA